MSGLSVLTTWQVTVIGSEKRGCHLRGLIISRVSTWKKAEDGLPMVKEWVRSVEQMTLTVPWRVLLSEFAASEQAEPSHGCYQQAVFSRQ